MTWLRAAFLILVSLGAACAPRRSPHLLCSYCADDAHCGGNPCFQDLSGERFCGAPCGDCPAGFSCQPVVGVDGRIANSCFPDNASCLDSPVPGSDAGAPSGPPPGDLGASLQIQVAGPVGPQGGTVDHLLFGFTGDTRPDFCDTPYPKGVIEAIFARMKDQGMQFALDQGDHMFNCGYGASAFDGARAQMNLYVGAANSLGRTVFMTMGNHECSGPNSQLCTLGSYAANPNYTAYMDSISSVTTKPYYRFDVETQTGLAVFIVVADNVWDEEERSWLEAQLSDADARAKYTIVSRHHPAGNTENPAFKSIHALIQQHKYTLLLTGHSHLYRREPNDPRALVMGLGGAPLTGSGSYWGFGTVEQRADDRLYVTIYDSLTGNPMDQFSVGPQ